MELKDIEQRLLTRFKWGLSTQLNTPDYDTKAQDHQNQGSETRASSLRTKSCRYLADNISANVREIEGALVGPGSQYLVL